MIKIKCMIVPKFEIGRLSGDEAGEAQLFYENYCAENEEYELSPGYRIYFNRKNGVALGVTGAGKTNAAVFMTSLLSDSRFDFSDCYFISVGCAGSSYGTTVYGDVAVIYDTVDYDLGYQTIVTGNDGGVDIQWYDNPDTCSIAHTKLNTRLCDRVYELAKNTELKTTANTVAMLKKMFPGMSEADMQPAVIKGTTVSGDCYWKGINEHRKVIKMCGYFGCSYPYAMTEMEDSVIANVLSRYGFIDRLIDIRVSVNFDILPDGVTAEEIWGQTDTYEEKVKGENSENLDIFPAAMENLFNAGKPVIDAILDGTI